MTMQNWKCTVHDLQWSLDDDTPSLKKIKDFYARCPACAILEYRAAKDELEKVTKQRDALVEAIDIARTVKATK